MTPLDDKDAVGLGRISLEIAEVMMESLVRKGISDKSDIEYFSIDVNRAISDCVKSDLARAELTKIVSKMHTELWNQVDMDQGPVSSEINRPV